MYPMHSQSAVIKLAIPCGDIISPPRRFHPPSANLTPFVAKAGGGERMHFDRGNILDLLDADRIDEFFGSGPTLLPLLDWAGRGEQEGRSGARVRAAWRMTHARCTRPPLSRGGMNETGWKGDQRWSARLYTPSFPPFFPDFLSLQRERGAIIILISILISRKEKKKKKERRKKKKKKR